jgi:phosphoglycolate phosphatase
VFESLDAIRANHNGKPISMAVLTNKPVGPARAICEGLGLSRYFSTVYGGDSFDTKKPDPKGLLSLIREASVSPDETLMVGDSDIDVLTARNVGAWSIGCKFGLSPHTLETVKPDAMVDSAHELAEAIGSLQA